MYIPHDFLACQEYIRDRARYQHVRSTGWEVRSRACQSRTFIGPKARLSSDFLYGTHPSSDPPLLYAPNRPCPNVSPLSSLTPSLPQRLPRKTRQHKARPVDLLVVVLAQLLLLLRAPAPEWLLDIALSVLAADHKANLAGGVRGDGSVCVLDGGEDLKARFAEIGDEAEVKPLVLGYH